MGAFHIWRRRWILTSFLLVLALAGSGVAFLKAPRTYQAMSTVVLLASRNSAKATGGGNPYLSFSDALSTTASIISAEITDSRIASNLKAQGFPEGYQVVSESTLSNSSLLPAPFLLVTVTGSNSVLVERTLYGVTREIGELLNGLQNGISHNNRIMLLIASFVPRATLSITSTARPLVAAIGLLVVLALCVPLVVDAQGARRRMARWAGSGGHPSPIPAQWEEPSVRNGSRQPRSVAVGYEGELPSHPDSSSR